MRQALLNELRQQVRLQQDNQTQSLINVEQQDDGDDSGHVLHQVNSEPLSNLGQGLPANATYPAATTPRQGLLTKDPSAALHKD